MTAREHAGSAARPSSGRRRLSSGAIALIAIAGVVLGLVACGGLLAVVSAVYDARGREVDLTWSTTHFERGPVDAYGARTCTPTGSDARSEQGTRLVLTDVAGRPLTTGRISAGVVAVPGTCLVVAAFDGTVPVRDNYRLRVGRRPPVTLHPVRDDLCDPDQARYSDTLTLEAHPPVTCAG